MAPRILRPRLLIPAVVLVGAAGMVAQPSFSARTVGSGPAPPPSTSLRCWFQPDMRLLRMEIPDVVGECIENQHYNPENGDTLQRTTGGLMVWRRADRTTAFTDGARTWARGPNGLESRLNSDRFQWEPLPGAEATAATAVVNPAQPTAPQASPVATRTLRPIVVTTPSTQGGAALGGAAAALVPSVGDLIASATEMVLVSSLKSSGLPVANVQALTVDTDPTHQLGKPGQYSSKITWRDQRVAGEDASIELFADEVSMKARLQALQSVPRTAPQYTPYVFADGPHKAVMHLPKGIPPDQVPAYQRWLATIK